MVLFRAMMDVDAYYKRGSAAMGGFSKLFFTPDLTIFSNYNDLLHDLLMSDCNWGRYFLNHTKIKKNIPSKYPKGQ